MFECLFFSHKVFHYALGISIGIVSSVFILVLVASKFLPKVICNFFKIMFQKYLMKILNLTRKLFGQSQF